jgi:hypothetical protein
MADQQKMIPIYTSKGETGAVLLDCYIFNLAGDWIGWIDAEKNVFSVHGHYVGKLSKDPRILRRREWGYGRERRTPPATPEKVSIPPHFPLPPMLPEIPTFMMDVLEEYPEMLPGVDFGDLRDDMD